MTHTFVLRTKGAHGRNRRLTFNDSFVSRLKAAFFSQPDALFAANQSLRSGSHVDTADAEIGIAFTQTAPASNRSPRMLTALGCATIGGCLLASVLALVVLGYFFTRDITPAVTVIPAPALLTPQEFGQSSRDLAQAVAGLNAAEYRFLQSARAAVPAMVSLNTVEYRVSRVTQADKRNDELGNNLQDIAARAMTVSAIASKLGNTTASQDGASDAAMQSASQYFAISRYAAALVIEAQNAREGLASGALTSRQAAAVIAEYSARLWNPAAVAAESGGSPFAEFLSNSPAIPQAQFIPTDQITNQLGGAPQLWMAAAPDTVTVNLIVPNSTIPPGALSRTEALTLMTTTEGQADADAARQLAAAIIQAGGDTNRLNDQPGAGGVSATFSSAFAVSSPANESSGSVPAFTNGTANTVTQSASSNDIISTLIALGPDNTPTVQSQTPIQEVKPVITLTISNLVIKQVNQRAKDSSTFEADVNYEFDVQWQASLANPQFTLSCVSGNHFEITTASGVQHISAKGPLILFPGAVDAFCYASRNGNTLGSASVHFLVGDPAAATQRANQVETDSVSLDITLTADALGTKGAELNNAVATQAVLGTENALSTEVIGTQNAEFLATVTEIARQTLVAVPAVTDTPLPTATFTPVLVETLYLRGDQAALSTANVLQPGRLYRFCFSGVVYLDSGPVEAYQLMHVNGISVPVSGCMAIEGTGAVAVITCGHGTAAEDPGGYSIQVIDLGPW